MSKRKEVRVILLAVVAVFFATIVWPDTPERTCKNVSDEEVLKDVHQSFMKSLPNYPSARKELGTLTPDFYWDNVERSSNDNEKTMMLPFTAKGPAGSVNYIGIYSCNRGGVEFSIEPKEWSQGL